MTPLSQHVGHSFVLYLLYRYTELDSAVLFPWGAGGDVFFPFLSHRGWIPAAFLCIENQKVRGGHGLFLPEKCL